MLNTEAMKLITYGIFGVMFFLSVKDFNKFNDETKGKNNSLDMSLLIRYIHKVELRIGVILFFVMSNILVISKYI